MQECGRIIIRDTSVVYLEFSSNEIIDSNEWIKKYSRLRVSIHEFMVQHVATV